ncbi:MAG: outer membrane beta-barrel protein [Rikenellaceae bacterium]
MNKFFKSIVMLTVALSATAFVANAQIYYGVTAGANVSNFKLTDAANTDLSSSQLGYQAGVMAGIDLLFLEVGAEALWVHNTMNLDGYDSDNKVVSNSVEIPVLASLSILGPLNVKVGPSFMVYNDAKIKYADGHEDLNAVKSSVGYVVGLGLNIFKLTFDVRYNGQFKKDTSFLGIDSTASEYDIKASTFSASVGYRF